METKIVVLVTDRGDDKHGEISVLDDPKKAERLVETLLEAGFERERIRVFSGDEMDMQVTHRPVVTLVNEEEGEEEAEKPAEESPSQEGEQVEAEVGAEAKAEAVGDEQEAATGSETKAASSFSNDYAFLGGP